MFAVTVSNVTPLSSVTRLVTTLFVFYHHFTLYTTVSASLQLFQFATDEQINIISKFKTYNGKIRRYKHVTTLRGLCNS